MAGLFTRNKKQQQFEPYKTTQLPNGGTAGFGGGGPDTPAMDPNIPIAEGRPDGTIAMNPAMAAIHEDANTPHADKAYTGPGSDGLFKGMTNGQAQDARVGLFAAKQHKKAVDEQNARLAAEMDTAKANQQSGNMTIRDADKLGLLGAKNRYSKDFVIFDGAGNPMQVDAATYVASLNRQIQGQNEADKNRKSAESIATTRGQATQRGLFKPVTVKNEDGSESVVSVDTGTGQEANPPIYPTSAWDQKDVQEFDQLSGWNAWHQAQVKKNPNGTYTRPDGVKESHYQAIERNKTQLGLLQDKYAGGNGLFRSNGNQPPAPEPTALNPNQPAPGTPGQQVIQQTQDEFIADYTKEYGHAPTQAMIKAAQGKYWQ